MWNLKANTSITRAKRPGVDIMNCFKAKYKKRSSSRKKSKSRRRSSKKSGRRSSSRVKNRSKKRSGSKTNSVNSSRHSNASKTREQEIVESVRRVKDLTDKCLDSILNQSKGGQKPKCYKMKPKSTPPYRNRPKGRSRKSKVNKNLSRLEKLYQDMEG